MNNSYKCETFLNKQTVNTKPLGGEKMRQRTNEARLDDISGPKILNLRTTLPVCVENLRHL